VSDAVNKDKTKKHPGGQKLAVKLLTYVLLFSSFVTLATSSYIIYSDYLQATNELDQSISQIKAGYQESISYSLWNFDSPQIKTQLAGILNVPGVLNVYIETKEGLLHSAGDFEQSGSQKHAFDLFFTSAERQYPLGVLSINIDYKGLYETLFNKAINIITTQFIKTFSVSLFILFIFQRLVTQRLVRMSRWASHFNLNNLDYELSLNPRASASTSDEIDAVASAINSMRISLKSDIKKRELVEVALNKSQYKLSIAINNAELGFCEYNQKTDRLIGNEHFSKHLGITPQELESLENPIDWFKILITGDRAIEQRERINQLLHGHMERICTELSMELPNNEVQHFDTTIQASEWDDNGLPTTIVICLLDKTAQVNASNQASELNYALEQKVTKRTEELTYEQVQSKAEIKKLQQQLASSEQQKKRQLDQGSQRPLEDALIQLQKLTNIDPSNINNTEVNLQLQQANGLISLLSSHLAASHNTHTQTFDVVSLIQDSLIEFKNRFSLTTEANTRLPFSLMLDSHQALLTYCFNHCLITIKALNPDRFDNLYLTASLQIEEDSGLIRLTYDNPAVRVIHLTDNGTLAVSSNEIIILNMCNAMLEDRYDGSVYLTQEEGKLTIELRFSINAHA
jgi:PAS domain-containing protein